jgi:hypothetical protein
MHSQNILKIEPRVRPVVNTKGDTLIQIKLSDAKILLQDVLEKEVCDSTVAEYIQLDNLRSGTIALQKDKIQTLETKFNNDELRISNLESVLKNKDTELGLLNDIIKKQGREIMIQKVFKIGGFSLALAIPITYLLIHK